MRTIAVPNAPASYNQHEEQIFRDTIRRGVQQSATEENLHLVIKKITNLPTFANDVAAGAGGLTTGQFYINSGSNAVTVKI